MRIIIARSYLATAKKQAYQIFDAIKVKTTKEISKVRFLNAWAIILGYKNWGEFVSVTNLAHADSKNTIILTKNNLHDFSQKLANFILAQDPDLTLTLEWALNVLTDVMVDFELKNFKDVNQSNQETYHIHVGPELRTYKKTEKLFNEKINVDITITSTIPKYINDIEWFKLGKDDPQLSYDFELKGYTRERGKRNKLFILKGSILNLDNILNMFGFKSSIMVFDSSLNWSRLGEAMFGFNVKMVNVFTDYTGTPEESIQTFKVSLSDHFNGNISTNIITKKIPPIAIVDFIAINKLHEISDSINLSLILNEFVQVLNDAKFLDEWVIYIAIDSHTNCLKSIPKNMLKTYHIKSSYSKPEINNIRLHNYLIENKFFHIPNTARNIPRSVELRKLNDGNMDFEWVGKRFVASSKFPFSKKLR